MSTEGRTQPRGSTRYPEAQTAARGRSAARGSTAPAATPARRAAPASKQAAVRDPAHRVTPRMGSADYAGQGPPQASRRKLALSQGRGEIPPPQVTARLQPSCRSRPRPRAGRGPGGYRRRRRRGRRSSRRRRSRRQSGRPGPPGPGPAGPRRRVRVLQDGKALRPARAQGVAEPPSRPFAF